MNLKEKSLYTASLVLFVVAVYSYFYESRYTGLLPVVTYPFRTYTIPIALTGLILLVLALIARKFSPEAKNKTSGFISILLSYLLEFQIKGKCDVRGFAHDGD